MGLDGVELVLEVESRFGISIPEASAPQIVTVADLYDVVLSEMRSNRLKQTQRFAEQRDSTVCTTASTFYALRRWLIGRSEIERRGVRPCTALDQVFPSSSRIHAWKELAVALKIRLPPLVRPRWLTWVAIAIAALWITWLTGQFGLQGAARLFFPAVAVALLALALEIHLTRPLARMFPAECATVGDLARQVMHVNCAVLLDRYSTWNPTEVWESLRELIATTLGIEREKVVPSARFVRDLGMG